MTDLSNHKKQFSSVNLCTVNLNEAFLLRQGAITTTALHAEQTSALVYMVISKLGGGGGGGGGLKVAIMRLIVHELHVEKHGNISPTP